MDWVNGLTLDQYIERNLLHQKALSWLPSHFRNLVSELEHLGIAHGDLQHGNIMIHSEDSSMVLVDYDAMYLPELSGMTSNETGHRNYQHPTRLKQYDNRIDRFSSLVIFTALESILERHNLWRKYSTGENMIFTREDFISPETSAVFREVCALQRSGRSGLELKEICKTANYNSVPRLEDFISNEKNYTPEKFVPYSDSISGKIVEIQGVQYTSQGTPFARIVFSDGDVAWVWPPALSLFKEPSKYLGQNVSVKGQRLQDHLEFRNSSEISPLEEPRRATESFIAPSPLPTHPSTTRHSYFWVVPLLAGGIIGLVGWGFSPLASFAVWVTSIVFSYLVKRQGLSLGEASITYPRPPVQPTVHMHRGMPCKMPLAWDPSKGRWYCYKQQDYPD
jgi:serine/threonine protein kinase